MINTRLVLVSPSVYTFDMSKTTFPERMLYRQGSLTLHLMEEFPVKVFVTGATGFVGSAVVRELLAARHQVIGLARSDAGAASLAALGVEVQRGTLDDLDNLRSAAAASDGVIHTAFANDALRSGYAAFMEAAQAERRAIEALGEALAGSDRPLVVTSGTAFMASDRPATEEDVPDANRVAATGNPRNPEDAAMSLVSRGVRASIVRLPPSVHGEGDHGFVPTIINVARAKGVSAYPGEGSNRWASVHRFDAAHLFRLALENAPAGSRFHAVADEGVSVRDIASVIGRRLTIPVVSLSSEEVNDHFGWIGAFFSMNLSSSSTLTQQRLGWQPVQPGLLADIDHDYYFKMTL